MPTALALLTLALATAATPQVATDAGAGRTPPSATRDDAPPPRPRSAFGAAIAEMTRTLQSAQAPAPDAHPADALPSPSSDGGVDRTAAAGRDD